MSARSSRLSTLVRVAELQEAVARGHAGRALVATRAAEQAHVAQLQVLRTRRLQGGTREALTRSADSQLAQAAATAQAAQEHEAAALEQRQAVQGWTAARLRHRLLTELEDRQRELVRADRDRREQQEADEMAASRRTRR